MQAVLDFFRSDISGVSATNVLSLYETVLTHRQLLWLLFSLSWGTVKLFSERRATEESGWRFGQVVPVVLLLSPLLLMVEGFSGKMLLLMPPAVPFNGSDPAYRSGIQKQ